MLSVTKEATHVTQCRLHGGKAYLPHSHPSIEILLHTNSNSNRQARAAKPITRLATYACNNAGGNTKRRANAENNKTILTSSARNRGHVRIVGNNIVRPLLYRSKVRGVDLNRIELVNGAVNPKTTPELAQQHEQGRGVARQPPRPPRKDI